MGEPNKKRNTYLSLFFLLFSNIITIIFAIIEGWNASTIIWIYWFQSISIGFFNFIRILKLKEFSTEGFSMKDLDILSPKEIKNKVAFFFLFHYGGFHIFYLIFLLAKAQDLYGYFINYSDLIFILLISLIFFINHFISYTYNKPSDTKKIKIGALMFYPYARIVPMHIIILLTPTFTASVLPFFLVLKTIADVIMHLIEDSMWKKQNL